MVKQKRNNYDEQWKFLITEYLDDFADFFLPDLYKDIDWKVEPEFLEQELREFLKKQGKRRHQVADKIVKVKLKTGQTHFLIIHVEIQGYFDKNYAEYMFKAFNQLHYKYLNKETGITSFVLYTGDPPKNYNTYTYSKYGVFLEFTFNAVRLKDFTEGDLMRRENTFSLVLLAAKYVFKYRKSKKEEQDSFRYKLIRLMIEKKMNKDKILALFGFIEYLLHKNSVNYLEINTLMAKEDINENGAHSDEKKSITSEELEAYKRIRKNMEEYYQLETEHFKLQAQKAEEEARKAEEEARKAEEKARKVEEEARKVEEKAQEMIAEEQKRLIRELHNSKKFGIEEIATLFLSTPTEIRKIIEN